MKKFAVILVLLSITRIGVAYADTNSSTTYFFGEKNATANLNQVLALLIGPKGDPGPAGVAGKNGFNGMNGKDGKDGLPGAPGAVGAQGLIGPPGASVLVASFSGVRGPCTNGGYSATDGNGNVVYSCNGTNGSNGTGGGGVTNIINQYGSDSSTSPLDYGEAVLKTSTCEADNTVYIKPTTYFTGSAFYYQEIKLGDRNSSQTNSKADIHSTCAGKFAYFYFTMEAADSSGSTRYAIDDVVACKFEFPLANDGRYTATGMWQFSINDSNSSCGVYGQLILSGGKKVMTKLNSPSFSFELSDINTKDTKDMIAFEIASS